MTAIARLEKEVADNNTIKSPHAGCVVEITAAEGQYLNPGTRLGTLQTIRQIPEVVQQLMSQEGGKIEASDDCELSIH